MPNLNAWVQNKNIEVKSEEKQRMRRDKMCYILIQYVINVKYWENKFDYPTCKYLSLYCHT